MLATGGGLLFTGKETGEFIALDADTGKQLWQFQTGSGINAHADHLHAQRPTIRHRAVGHRRPLLERQRASKLKDKVPQGGSVWTFALLPE